MRTYDRALSADEVKALYLLTSGEFTNQDCKDTNATVYPLATEVCDYTDNDCDGGIDE